MERHVHIDFETRSLLSVTDVGAWVYSRHPSTSILCAAYCVDDSEITLLERGTFEYWDGMGVSSAERLYQLAADPNTIFIAHNAFFEQCIWRNIMVAKYGFPDIPVRRWRCTAAKAASMSLPRDLAGVGKALNLETQKDEEGGKIMLKLSRPRKITKKNDQPWYEEEDHPDLFQRLYEYNITDVETERLVDKALPSLNEREQEIWFIDQEINFRGIRLDLAAIHQVKKFIDKTVKDLMDEFQTLTWYALNSPSQVAAFSNWLAREGVELPNLQAATVDKLLKRKETLPQHVARALEIRRALSKISTAKYDAMLQRYDSSDGKLRDILLYCAALTKRWGGRGVQLQNLPRGTVDSDACITHILLDDYDWFCGCYPDRMAAYSSVIRGMLIASPGCDLLVSDFSAIEARVVSWLAGQQSTLDIFRLGECVYCHEAKNIFGRTVTKKDKYERSVGKVSELALGYNGGIRAFGTMARGYSVDISPAYSVLWPTASTDEQEKARFSYESYLKRALNADDPDPLDRASGYAADIIKQRYRKANPLVVRYWRDIEAAAIQAVATGQKVEVSSIYCEEDGTPLETPIIRPTVTFGMYQDYLLCRLPSGNCLVYPNPRLSERETPWGAKKFSLSYRTQDDKFQFIRTYTYGGKLVENITQAVSRELLADSMLRAQGTPYENIVLHVHDELVCEVPEGTGDIKELEQLMEVLPSWAAGLPIKAEGWRGKRYRKG